MEQEQTISNENQVGAPATFEANSTNQTATPDSFQVTFDFLKTPITQIADYIIIAASKLNTSDIHFDPRENGMMVRFRIDGDLQDYSYIPKAYERNLTTRLKLLANMNITESRLPQDGAIKGMFGDTYLDMRVSCLPLNEGEKIVIRILDYTRSLQGIDSLGFHPDNLVKLKRMMAAPNGIILTTGATGSGKSTTTYSILQGLNTPETNIITVEDPIEMNIQGINQVQVNSEIGMTFAAALRSILRQDPNVILIGEIRDSETAQIAVRSAITGHLVLSTIHTNNSLSTIERLMDMDVERYLLSTALVGIISQRLAKGICPHCRFQRKTTPYEQKIFRNFLRLDVKTIWDANPKGCSNCRRGYKGRIAIQEVLELDDDIRTAISNPKLSKDELRSMVYTDKTITMLQDALIKCINGETNFEEVYRVIEMENEEGEDYESELTAVIEDITINQQIGINGADILRSLQLSGQQSNNTIQTPNDIDTKSISVKNQPNNVEVQSEIVNIEQPPESIDQQPQVTSTQPASIDQQPQVTSTQPASIEQQPQVASTQPASIEQQPQVTSTQPPVFQNGELGNIVTNLQQPTNQYITNPDLERQRDIPEIVQALPTNVQENALQEETQSNPTDAYNQQIVESTSQDFTSSNENLSEEIIEVPQAEDNFVQVAIPEVEPDINSEPENSVNNFIEVQVEDNTAINQDAVAENGNVTPSDGVIGVPSVDKIEEIVNDAISDKNMDDAPSEDMFNGNVMVSDEGVEEQEEYSIFDFKNNRTMTFDENNEPVNDVINEDVQIIPTDEDKLQSNITNSFNSISEDYNTIDTNYEIDLDVIGLNNENNDCKDGITSTIDFEGIIVEANEIIYNFDNCSNSHENQVFHKDDSSYEDIYEEYNPLMISYDKDNNSFTQSNSSLNDKKEAIGFDFVDASGPLLEELPRLGTEIEDEDMSNSDVFFEDTLKFDPEAFNE